MEAFRKIIDSEHLTLVIDLPESLRYRDVEVIVLPRMEGDEVVPRKKKTGDRSGIMSLKGILKDKADPELRKLEKDAWAQAAAEKHLEKMKNDSL